MKLIVISNATKNEGEAVLVTKLFENGLETFHVRKPKFSTRELEAYLKAIPRAYHSKLVIHSHHMLALKFDLKGIHLTKSHKQRKWKTSAQMRWLKFKKPGLLISTSFRKLASLFEETFAYDYVFLSPVFDSLTSKYQSGFTEHSLKITFEKTKYKVVARGGTDVNCLQKVDSIGFAGVAFYSALWNKKEPLEEFEAIVSRCRELGITAD